MRVWRADTNKKPTTRFRAFEPPPELVGRIKLFMKIPPMSLDRVLQHEIKGGD
jgi:hypothetical protein